MTTASNVVALSNSGKTYEDFLGEIKQLGAVKGKAGNAQILTGIRCVEESASGLINVDKAPEIYRTFLSGETAAGVTTGAASEEKKSADKQTSELRQFIKLGALRSFDPVKMVNSIIPLVAREKQSEQIERKKKAYDCLVSIVRAQVASPDMQLTEDEMIEACQPKTGREKTEADKLGVLRDKLDRILKESPSEQTREAMELLQERIDELGGTSKERREAEKEAKRLAKEQNAA